MYARTQLFVPGNRPDRFEKACQAGADLVCIDLEDAVGPTEKEQARRSTLEWLAETAHEHVSVRINSPDTKNGSADIAALVKSDLKLPFVMVPKVSSRAEIDALDKALPHRLGPLFVIIETAKGMLNSAEIFAHSRVTRGMYGAVDYAGDVGCDDKWETHLYARSHLVACAAAHEVALFDSPHIEVRDLDACEASTHQAKALGIYARSAIHPAQIARIHAALAPSETEIAWAKDVMAAYEAAQGNVVLLNGKFIERPVVKTAQRVLVFAQN